jgi:tRNA threonylcarbamoyl adenosine modification protein (Sua5/YciO/YrdC/YwlC family)
MDIQRIQKPSSVFRNFALVFWMFVGLGRLCSAFQVSVTEQSYSRSILRRTSTLNVAVDRVKDMTSSNSDNNKVRAKLVSVSDIQACGKRIREGELVSFPTETVYGLGCNALDPSAIIKVFQAKERPLTDPLISHVSDNQVAYDLWEAKESSLEGKALRCLCNKFWPGPLTLVAKAAPHVPDLLMAHTGFVACRAPQHPISIALIDAAQVPIAAPSANKFGHVSPTRAQHVWDDLKFEDVWIVDTDAKETTSICEVGVESSVAKIELETQTSGRITLLRQGAICVADIQECLHEAGLASNFTVQAETKKATDETVANVAPGQTIRHYSPDIPSFILSESSCNEVSVALPEELKILSKTVIIDFGGKLLKWKDACLAYRELSETGDSSQATKSLFDTLRWAERVADAEQIIFPEISESKTGKEDALVLALKDRLTRAASGVIIDQLHSRG